MPNVDVLDSFVHYNDAGEGPAIVLLHGNPATSHMWRNVAPSLGKARILTPDPVGMGRSGRPDIAYRLADHARYLDGWFDALGLERVVVVGHDWGGTLAIDWAARHPDRVAGLAFFETIIKPIALDDVSPQARERAEMIRSDKGEEFALRSDSLIRTAFTGGVLTPVGEDDLAAYLAPYPTPESRRPLLAWARQLPIGGEPADVVSRIESFHPWLAASDQVPKLLLTFEGSPTLAMRPPLVEWCSRHIAGLEVVACGAAGHHAAEDRPQEIATATSAWLNRHALR
jgi:haloalkane dehalogenase